MIINLGFKPNPKQELMLTDTTHRYICYGGAKGGGKTWALRVKAILLAANYDGIKILVIRRTYPELRNNHIQPMMAMLRGIAKYTDTDHTFKFPNGSTIEYGYCATYSDVVRYQGHEYDILMIDEATTITEEVWNELKLCVRGTNGLPKRVYLTCNPGGVGHEWVKRLFIDRDFRDGENPDDYTFIPASVYDNKVLMQTMPDYVKQLESLPPDRRAALLEGDWNAYEGRFFPEFKPSTHVVEPFEIPSHWLRYRAIDYGLDMLACLWIAVSDTGDEYVYRELHEPDLIVAEAARKIIERSYGETIYITYAPPDLWGRTKDSGITMAEIFRDNGVSLTQASNDRIQGWQAVKDHIKIMSDMPKEDKHKPTRDDILYANSPNYQAQKEEESQVEENPPHSRLRVFSTCPVLIRHMQALQYDDNKIGDAATEPHEITHICDALRYYCVSRITVPKPQMTELEAMIRKNTRKRKLRSMRAT